MFAKKLLAIMLLVGVLLSTNFINRAQAAGAIVRVSLAEDGSQSNGFSDWGNLSADGRYITFYSYASNLVAGDTNAASDVFVRDTQTGTVQRVSVNSSGVQGNADSHDAVISADGRYVAFISHSTNLAPHSDTSGSYDIFVHNRQTGTTTAVTISLSGELGSDGRHSYHQSISADGRYIAFNSSQPELVAGDTNIISDVFVRDMQTGTISRVSVGPGGVQSNGSSYYTGITDDGRYIVFHSGASNLVADDTNGWIDVFVHDNQTGITTRLSRASDGAQAEGGDSLYPSISTDGRFVTFRSAATNLVPGDTNAKSDIFLHDRQTGVTSLVSISTGGGLPNHDSLKSTISADGRFVAFDSYASNLVSNDTNGQGDVFVRDLQAGTTTRVSLAADGSQGLGGEAMYPTISTNGQFIIFTSFATNLVAGDTNSEADIFVYEQNVPVVPTPTGPTLTPSPLPTIISTFTPTLTPTHTPTKTPTFTPTSTFTPSITPTYTPTPTVYTLTLQPNAAAGLDTYIYSGASSTNYGTNAAMGVGEDNNTNNRIARSLIKFDLSSVPANAAIQDATLSIWTGSDLSSNNRTIRVYRLKTPFNETQATWNVSATGVNWQMAGASGANDRESTAIGSVTILNNEALNVEKQIPLTPAGIQEMVAGTFVNRGFLIQADTEQNDRFSYRTSDATTSSQRPKLVIQYTIPTVSSTSTSTPTATPITASLTFTPSFTPTTIGTATFTLTAFPTFTPTWTPTASNTPQATFTPSITPTQTSTALPTFTATATNTFTPTSTPSSGFPINPVLDNFNRANGAIGTSWSGYASAFSIASNQLDVASTGWNTSILWKNTSFGADQEAYVTLSQIDAGSNEQALILKSQSNTGTTAGLIYVMYDGAGKTVQVWTYHPSQDWVQHGNNIPVTFVNGDQFGVRARPDGTIEVYKNGMLLATRSITAWPFYANGGYLGFWFVNAPGALLDNFGGGSR